MVKTDDYLKVFYINMLCVNCTYHKLNTIAERVKEIGTFLSKRIKNQFKKSFFKSFETLIWISIYKDILPGVSLTLAPILSIWKV